MTTAAMIGHGTLFQTETADSPADWRTLAEVSDIVPPAMSRNPIDLTHEHAPYEWVESMPGMKPAAELSLKINFIPGGDTFADLEAEFEDRLVRNCRLMFPNGAIWPFAAYVKSIEPDAPTDAPLMATIKFQVSGRIGPFE